LAIAPSQRLPWPDVRALPLTDPGTPDLRSAGRYLWWVAKGQWRSLLGGITFGVLWMSGQAVVPALLGHAIDALTNRDTAALYEWSAWLLAVGLLQAGAGVARHRFAVGNWLVATFRTQQLVSRTAARLGASLPAQVGTGDVVSVTAADVFRVGGAYDVSARAAGAVVSFLVVAVILLRSSVFLGLVVLLGVPLLTLVVAPLLRPLKARQSEQRRLVGELTTLGADTVAGLRVLRGIGGEDTFLDRFRASSQRVRVAGVRVAAVQALLDAAQVLLPGIFIVTVTWLGARLAVEGDLTVGQLVAFYGYAAFLVTPLRTATEAADKVTTAMVSAARVVAILRLEPLLAEPDPAAGEPSWPADLVDPTSGLVVSAGRLVGVAAAVPEDGAELADRLGRYVDAAPGAPVTLGGVALPDLPVDTVRRLVLVSDKDPRLFTGTLRGELDPHGSAEGDDEVLLAAVRTADAEDVLDALPDGLDSEVEERGRSLSGGQRQRLVLARALVADPHVLVLDEPTSAVDAHTEARIAHALRGARAGRSTVVMTTSPLMLEQCDEVAFVDGGTVVDVGRHRELMHANPLYRSVVTRGESDLVDLRPEREHRS
jgi:ABC-type multidrug transport system fused ATPase/permease subunit